MATGDELRAVFRRVPAAVSVVTVEVEGYRTGLTVGSLVSLSLEPPLVGISISREAQLHELLREAGSFAVSILGAEQDAVAGRFAMGVPPIGMWTGLELLDGDGPPLLAGAAGWLVCGLHDEADAGDHTFFVGHVRTAETGPAERALVYVDRRYTAL